MKFDRADHHHCAAWLPNDMHEEVKKSTKKNKSKKIKNTKKAHSMVSVHIGSEFSTWMYKKGPCFSFCLFLPLPPFGFEYGPVAHMSHVYVCIEWRMMTWLGRRFVMGIERLDGFLPTLCLPLNRVEFGGLLSCFLSFFFGFPFPCVWVDLILARAAHVFV